MPPGYVGRFAPSPTGPLHFGSLVAALASFLDARAHGGRWLVRMEDLDPPREMPGASELILRQLQAHGLEWDGDVLFQVHRAGRYQEILDSLMARGVAYYCDCSRKRVNAMGGVYDGHCYRGQVASTQDAAIRVHLPPDSTVSFEDRLQGLQNQDLNRDVGDFIVRRRDGLFAYQLAVVVDDWDQGITQVFRGIDLMASTARQIWLIRQLGAPEPVYSHLPVAINRHQQKLSKQHYAPSLDRLPAAENLRLALSWLGLDGMSDSQQPSQILARAVVQWSTARLVARTAMPAPASYYDSLPG